jgi:hypothetical protein
LASGCRWTKVFFVSRLYREVAERRRIPGYPRQETATPVMATSDRPSQLDAECCPMGPAGIYVDV